MRRDLSTAIFCVILTGCARCRETCEDTCPPDSWVPPGDTEPDADSDTDADTDTDTDTDIECLPSDFAVRVDGFAEQRFEYAAGPPVAADFDGDGLLDLALPVEATVRVLLNDGAFGFALQPPISAGGTVRDIAPLDQDDDGDQDLVVLVGDTVLRLLLGDGQGGFGEPSEWFDADCGRGPYSLETLELDGDGVEDVFVACQDGAWAAALLGTGEPVLATGEEDTDFTQLLSGDVDADGDIDVVLGGNRHKDNHLLRNDGSGTLTRESLWITQAAHRLALGDLDGDGDLDLASAHHQENDLLWIENTGEHWVEHSLEVWDDSYDSSYRITDGLWIEDLDGDGAPEIISGSDRGLWLWPGHADGPDESDWAQDMVQGLGQLLLEDLDGDGVPDAVIADDDGWLTIRRGAGDGSFASPAALYVQGSRMDLVVPGRLDGDDAVDLAVANPPGFDLYLQDPGSGRFAQSGAWEHHENTHSSSFPAADLGDLDGDGDLDLVAGNTYYRDELIVLLLDGAGGVDEARITQLTDGVTASSLQILRDLDGDDAPDLLLDHHNQSRVRSVLNDGDGGMEAAWFGRPDREVSAMASGDFDGDYLLDLVVHGEGLPELVFFQGLGDGSFSDGVDVAVEGKPDGLWASDLDRDGLDDLVFVDRDSSQLQVMLNLGDGDFEQRTVAAGLAPDRGYDLTSGDLDGDGDLDLVVYQDLDQRWHWAAGDGTGEFVDQGPFTVPGGEGDAPVLADADGDGDLDLFIQLRTTGNDRLLGVLHSPCLD